MVASGVCFVLLADPLELALAHPPGRRQIDIDRLAPDRSLRVPPAVILDAATGVSSSQEIIESYKPNHGGRTV